MTKYYLLDEYQNIVKGIEDDDKKTVAKGVMDMMDEIGIEDPQDLDLMLLKVVGDVQCTIANVQVDIVHREEN